MVTGHIAVVLIVLAIALTPFVELAGGEADLREEELEGQFGAAPPISDEVDDLIPLVGLDPLALQRPPIFFFDLISSVANSLMTPSFSASLSLS